MYKTIISLIIIMGLSIVSLVTGCSEKALPDGSGSDTSSDSSPAVPPETPSSNVTGSDSNAETNNPPKTKPVSSQIVSPPVDSKYRWADWEREDDYSQLWITDKPRVAEGMDISFIDAGLPVTLPDGRIASLELYIDPDRSSIIDCGDFKQKEFYYDAVFKLGDEIYPLETEYPIYYESIYVIYNIDDPRFLSYPFLFVITEDGFSESKIYMYGDTKPCASGFIEYIEPEYFTIGKHTHVLGTQRTAARYSYNSLFNGYWMPESSMYDLTYYRYHMPSPLTLLTDLDAYEITAGKAGYMLNLTTIPSGATVTPVKSNLIDFVIIADKNGKEYLITEYSCEQETINGLSVGEIFDGLYYAD